MRRYSFKSIFRSTVFSTLIFWGLASFVSADAYSVGFLRNLNPALWDQLGLNRRFTDAGQQLTMMNEQRWLELLKDIVDRLESRISPPDRSGVFGLPWLLYAKVTKKPQFDPALFPVLWLAFRDIRKTLPFEMDADFVAQLRDFQVVTFPAQLHWPSVDLSELSLLGATLNGHIFTWATLNHVNFSGAVIIHCHFQNCVLHDAIVTLAADVATSFFTACQDMESTETALRLSRMQSEACQGNHRENQLKRSRLLFQQDRCLITSGEQKCDNLLLEKPPDATGALVQYFRMLMAQHKYELLNQVITSPETLTHIHPGQYQNDPATVLHLAWAMYVLINRAPIMDQHVEAIDILWNLLVIGLVGIDMPDPDNVDISPGSCLHTAPADSLAYQAALLELMNSHAYRAVIIRKDNSCFYSAIAYHMPEANQPGVDSEISQGDWLRQVLGLLYLQYLVQQGFSAEQLAHLVSPDVYAAVATFAGEFPVTKPEAIHASVLVAAHDPVSVLHDLVNPTIWAETEYSSLAAILLQQPVYLIQMQHQELHLQLNHPNGMSETLTDIPAAPEGQHPLLVIHSGHSHWLTALMPVMLVLGRAAAEGGAKDGNPL